MVYSIAAKSGERPRWHQLEHAIKRNFGGLVEGEPVEIFKRYCQETDVSLPFVVVNRHEFKETPETLSHTAIAVATNLLSFRTKHSSTPCTPFLAHYFRNIRDFTPRSQTRCSLGSKVGHQNSILTV